MEMTVPESTIKDVSSTSDWKEVVLRDISSIRGGKRMPLGSSLSNTPTPHPYIRVSDMFQGGIDKQNLMYVPKDVFPVISRFTISSNDIFISVAGTLGLVGIVPSELDGANLTENADKICDIRCDRDYLYHYLTSEVIQRLIAMQQTVGAQPKLAIARIEQFPILLPPLPEQRAIAEVLTDIDALIESLDALITKKRAIKQGAMQQLLTGATRLPRFTGEWFATSVGQMGEIVTGGTPPTEISEYWHGDILWVTPTDISEAKDIFVSQRMLTPSGLASIREIPANSVLVTCIASIGKNAVLKRLGATNQQINAVVPHDGYDTDFLYYMFQNNKTLLMNNAGTTATPIVSRGTFAQIQFMVPTLAEQRAIAEVLSDMDAEIEALQTRLAKTRLLKQGMMQELLTGRIRLL